MQCCYLDTCVFGSPCLLAALLDTEFGSRHVDHPRLLLLSSPWRTTFCSSRAMLRKRSHGRLWIQASRCLLFLSLFQDVCVCLSLSHCAAFSTSGVQAQQALGHRAMESAIRPVCSSCCFELVQRKHAPADVWVAMMRQNGKVQAALTRNDDTSGGMAKNMTVSKRGRGKRTFEGQKLKESRHAEREGECVRSLRVTWSRTPGESQEDSRRRVSHHGGVGLEEDLQECRAPVAARYGSLLQTLCLDMGGGQSDSVSSGTRTEPVGLL